MSLHVVFPLIFRRFFEWFFLGLFPDVVNLFKIFPQSFPQFFPKVSLNSVEILGDFAQVWDFTLVGRDERFTSPQWTEALGPVWKVLMAGKIWKYIENMDKLYQYVCFSWKKMWNVYGRYVDLLWKIDLN